KYLYKLGYSFKSPVLPKDYPTFVDKKHLSCKKHPNKLKNRSFLKSSLARCVKLPIMRAMPTG
ncbi:MAG: hypothetical protein ACK4NN_18050, partial [Rheinheimera sp.]